MLLFFRDIWIELANSIKKLYLIYINAMKILYSLIFILLNIYGQCFSQSNPNATEDAKKVFNYLTLLSNDEFNGVISGQNCGHGTEILSLYDEYIKAMQQKSGKLIGMVGVDYEYLKEYSVDELKLTNSKLIEHWNKGGLVTINWTPTNVFDAGNIYNTSGTNLDELINPSSGVYGKWMSKLDRIAEGLKQLQDSGVVVLFRPMQESNSTWFWYGKHNANSFINVWKHLYDYFVKTKRLNNLLWVYSPVGDQNTFPFIYPGADYVDIVGGTSYNSDVTAWGYNDYTSYNKITALAEYGHDLNNAPGNFDMKRYVEKIKNNYPKVAYFLAWHNWTNTNMAIVSNQNGVEMLNDPGVINADKLLWKGVVTSINETKDLFYTYPNPVQERIFIQLKDVTGNRVKITVIDVLSIERMSTTINARETDPLIELSLSSLDRGWYSINVTSGNYSSIHKIYKE